MTPLDELLTFSVLIGFATLVLMEVALGIDNVVFVSLMLGHMPEGSRKGPQAVDGLWHPGPERTAYRPYRTGE